MNIPMIKGKLEQLDLLADAKRIAAKHHVTLDEMLGRKKSYRVFEAKRELWAFARVMRRLSFSDLATLFERDHSTIIAALRGAKLRVRAPSVPA